MPPLAASSAPATSALASGDFDRVAWCYDALAKLAFGGRLQRAQGAALQAGLPPGAPRVLVLGGGAGWVLTEILRLRPGARVLYLEASVQMLARAQRRLRREASLGRPPAQVEFRHGTEQSLRTTSSLRRWSRFSCSTAFRPSCCRPR